LGYQTKPKQTKFKMSKLDILAFGVHPDDVELSCAATIAKQISLGNKVGIVDLTKGQLGTRGSAELRLKEAEEAAKILGLSVRENLGMEDGYFENDWKHKLPIIKIIRKYRPEYVFANALSDRHPDHGRAAKLVAECCFYSGLTKIETEQAPWRPKVVLHYIQDYMEKPDLVIDITGFWEKKKEAIMAYGSQFYNPDSKEPETPISSESFFDAVKGRHYVYGRYIGVEMGEGFQLARPVGISELKNLI